MDLLGDLPGGQGSPQGSLVGVRFQGAASRVWYEGRQGAPTYTNLLNLLYVTKYTGSRLRPLKKPGGVFDDHLWNLPNRSHVHTGGGSVGRDGGRGIYPHPACSAASTLAAPGQKEKQVVGLGAPNGCKGCTLNIVTTASTLPSEFRGQPVQGCEWGNLHSGDWKHGERIGEAKNPGPWVWSVEPS